MAGEDCAGYLELMERVTLTLGNKVGTGEWNETRTRGGIKMSRGTGVAFIAGVVVLG